MRRREPTSVRCGNSTSNPVSIPAVNLQRMVQGRANPKRLTELATALYDLREWARIQSTLGDDGEIAIQKVWIEVRDWADGRALRHKLNLDSVPVALKQPTANAGMESLNND